MKKTIIALAVAGATVASVAQAGDATLYGRATFRLISETDQSLNANMTAVRIGVKGTSDNVVEGLTTGYRVEYQTDGNGLGSTNSDTDNFSVRQSNVYMSGGFGKVTFGRQGNPVSDGVNDKTDLLLKSSASLTPIPFRLGQAVVYNTPDMGGFTGYAGFQADGASDASSEEFDKYIVGVDFDLAGFGVSLGYMAENNAGDNAANPGTVALGLSYNAGGVKLGASYASTDEDAADVIDSTWTQLYAGYSWGNYTAGLQYEMTNGNSLDADDIADGKVDSDQEKVSAMLKYKLGPRTDVGMEIASYDNDKDSVSSNGKNDHVLLHYRVKF